MKILLVAGSLLMTCLAGCYSVEQSEVERGYRWIHRGKTDKALATFDSAIRKYPAGLLAHVGRADALFEAGRDQEAVTAYSDAIDLLKDRRPESVIHGESETIGHRTLSYQNQGLRFPFGLEPYLYLRRGGAYHSLAISISSSGNENLRKAVSDYDRALALAPDYQVAQEERSRLQKESEQLIRPKQSRSLK